ncbi:MAG: nuclear transport factor 2 family protein [Steroidobacteraceae bacterium]
MSAKENLDTVRAVLSGFNNNNAAAALNDTVHPDLRYTIRGRATVSGMYVGRKAMADAVRQIKELTNGTMTAVPEVVMAEGDNVMAYMRVTGERSDGRTYDNYQAYLFRFREGKLIEGQTIPVDQHAFEEFLRD